jgi:hypothetical protein
VTIVRIGATKKYATGWDQAFGKGGKKSTSGAAATKPAKAAKPAKKKAKRKAAK